MIDSYSFGSITVRGKNYRSDLIIYPDRIDSSWWRAEGHRLRLEDLQKVLDYRPEVLVIGQGKPGLMKVPAEVIRKLEERGIEVYAAPTPQAVRKYNEIRQNRNVVAALHLTC